MQGVTASQPGSIFTHCVNSLAGCGHTSTIYGCPSQANSSHFSESLVQWPAGAMDNQTADKWMIFEDGANCSVAS